MPPTDGRAQLSCRSCDQNIMAWGPNFHDFYVFFTFGPDVCPNAAPDRRDTAHLRGAPDAQHNRAGQTGPRRAVLKLQIFVHFFGGVRSGFVLPLLMQGGPSWGGPEIYIFSIFFAFYMKSFKNHRNILPVMIIFMILCRNPGDRALRA